MEDALSNDKEDHEVEMPSRSLIKLVRAAEIFESLDRTVDDWNQSQQLLAPARVPFEGDQRLEFFRPSEMDEIPLQAWESAFQDGVHNLRVALDSLCFELCHLEQTPTKSGQIYFPITAHENEWPERTKNLKTIPTPLLERIRQCQPWHRLDDRSLDPLQMLSRIDNADKHRATGVELDVMPVGQWNLRSPEPLPFELATTRDWPLAPWLVLNFTPPLERGYAALMPIAVIPIVRFNGLFAVLPNAQRWLYREAERAISFIASGEWPEANFQQVVPGPIWSPFPEP